MNRSYARDAPTSTRTRNAGGPGTRRDGDFTHVETDVVDGGAPYRRRTGSGGRARYQDDSDVRDYDAYHRYDSHGSYDSYDSYDSYGSYDSYDSVDDADDVYEYEDPIDRRWVWVAGVAGAILLIAIVCTVVILGGGDSGSVSKTVAATTPTTTAQDATTTAPPTARTTAAAPPAPITPLSPETVTTLAPSPTASAAPTPAVVAPASPRTITYMVAGTRPLLDLVTVVFTDGQGALQTQFNVALPWVRSVTLDPGVELKSVIATSLTGHLNCSVTDSNGTVLVAQNNDSMIATCTQ